MQNTLMESHRNLTYNAYCHRITLNNTKYSILAGISGSWDVQVVLQIVDQTGILLVVNDNYRPSCKNLLHCCNIALFYCVELS